MCDAAVETYTLSEWENIDEAYEDDLEEDVDFAEVVYGTETWDTGEDKTSQEYVAAELLEQFESLEEAEMHLDAAGGKSAKEIKGWDFHDNEA